MANKKTSPSKKKAQRGPGRPKAPIGDEHVKIAFSLEPRLARAMDRKIAATQETDSRGAYLTALISKAVAR